MKVILKNSSLHFAKIARPEWETISSGQGSAYPFNISLDGYDGEEIRLTIELVEELTRGQISFSASSSYTGIIEAIHNYNINPAQNIEEVKVVPVGTKYIRVDIGNVYAGKVFQYKIERHL